VAKKFKPGHLYDTIIDAYVFILKRNFNNDIFAINCLASYAMIHTKLPPSASLNAEKRVPKIAKYFLMPCNLRGNHWTLLIVDIQQKSIMHLDSYNYSNPTKEEVANIQKNLRLFYAVECSGDLVNVKCAQQKDSINCGIFVIHFIELLAQGKSFLTPCDTDRMRATIFKALIEDDSNTF
jgi:Ulp1 family protease